MFCISFIVTISILSVPPLWLYSILITLSGDVEILQKYFQFVIGISTVSLLIITLKCFFLKLYITVHKFDIFVFAKRTLTVVPSLMMII